MAFVIDLEACEELSAEYHGRFDLLAPDLGALPLLAAGTNGALTAGRIAACAQKQVARVLTNHCWGDPSMPLSVPPLLLRLG